VAIDAANASEQQTAAIATVHKVVVRCLPTGVIAKAIVARAVATAYTNQ